MYTSIVTYKKTMIHLYLISERALSLSRTDDVSFDIDAFRIELCPFVGTDSFRLRDPCGTRHARGPIHFRFLIPCNHHRQVKKT